MTRIPSPSRRLLAVVAAAPFIIAACSTADSEEPTDASVESGAATVTAAPAEADATTAEETPAEAATWLDIELADAVTGETFTLASLAGEVVAIEPMAIWCSNCKAQQNNVKDAYADIADAGVTYECYSANDCIPGQYCNEFHRCVWPPQTDGGVEGDGGEPYVELQSGRFVHQGVQRLAATESVAGLL